MNAEVHLEMCNWKTTNIQKKIIKLVKKKKKTTQQVTIFKKEMMERHFKEGKK